MKTLTSIRLPELTVSQIETLKTKTGLNQSEIITTAIDRMYQQETKMNTTFKTKQDALTAGFTLVHRGIDKDVSGPNSFGYAYKNANGVETVDVYLTEETNRLGQKGCFIPMYPPTR